LNGLVSYRPNLSDASMAQLNRTAMLNPSLPRRSNQTSITLQSTPHGGSRRALRQRHVRAAHACEDGDMTTYVALLRGINLGATNKIAMPALRAMTEELGYTGVATYINSGNLIFRTSKKAATVERALSGGIADTFGLTIDAMVRTDAQLKKVLDDNPYPDANPSQLTVAFLAKAPGPEAEKRVAAAAAEHEPFAFGDRCVYVNYSHGLANSKLAAQFSSIIGVSSTVRTIRTVAKLVQMSAKS
jgi:uncharacterized protein (DUF1697 family)